MLASIIRTALVVLSVFAGFRGEWFSAFHMVLIAIFCAIENCRPKKERE